MREAILGGRGPLAEAERRPGRRSHRQVAAGWSLRIWPGGGGVMLPRPSLYGSNEALVTRRLPETWGQTCAAVSDPGLETVRLPWVSR